MTRVRLVIPLGDPAGIGPELCAKLARAVPRDAQLVFVGDEQVWAREGAHGPKLPVVDAVPNDGDAVLLRSDALGSLPAYGRVDRAAGAASYGWVRDAVHHVQAGNADAVVTPPIHKEAWHAAGIPHKGHTQALRALANAPRALMVFLAGRLRVALASVHIPLRAVPEVLSTEDLVRDLTLMQADARRWLGLFAPRIAVCGVNPHAGEGGLLGSEDDAIVAPAVAAAQAAGIEAHGPLPADACIPAAHAGHYDMVLAMYHDQALPAAKALAPRQCVNATFGLPFLRTSVDHGTAFDIAGRGAADPASLAAAVRCAIDAVRHTRRS